MPRVRHRSFRYVPFFTALVAAALAPSAAQAQTAGWALDRYEPSPAGDVFFTAEHPWYGHGRDFMFRGGLTLDYANSPLVLRSTDVNGAETVTQVVSNMTVLHVQAGIGLWNRVGIHLSLPLSLAQDGSGPSVGGLGAARSAAIGDPRLGVRVRLYGEADRDPISVHVGGAVFINAGALGVSPGLNTTDDGFRGRLSLNLAGRIDAIRWSFSTGLHLRQNTITVLDTTIGNDLFANAAVGFVALDNRLTIGPEIWASTVLDQAFKSSQHNNLEALIGAHYLIGDVIQVGVGAGPGFTHGAGTPSWRLLANVSYAPSDSAPTPTGPGDVDNDGVLDPDDQCPTTPQGAHPDPTRVGCPLADTDGDGVYDNEDQCVTIPMGANPDPSRRGCPRGDHDNDGIFDDEDQCVDVPQGPNPDPDRRGCPDGDTDNDTVRNSIDQCRTVPQGPMPDPDRAGCPLPDRDHDCVPDRVDACPDQPGAPSTDPRRNGCPGRVRLDSGILTILEPVFFATDQDRILPRSQPVMEAVADALRATPFIRRVRVEGHTDDAASDEHNNDLSQRRAASVRAWLTEHGVEEGRLEARGYGESRPLRPVDGLTGNALRTARGQNRRVMFMVVDPPQDGTGSGPDSSAAPGAHHALCGDNPSTPAH